MASPTRIAKARDHMKHIRRGLKRKKLLARNGSTLSAAELFKVQEK